MKLTPKQDKFVQAYIDTDNATQATIDAGYNCTSRDTARYIGYENTTKPHIKQAIQAKRDSLAKTLEGNSMLVLTNMLEMAYNLDTPIAVRLKCLMDLLDRAGYSAKNNIALSGGDSTIQIETRHTSELAKRARQIMPSKEEPELA